MLRKVPATNKHAESAREHLWIWRLQSEFDHVKTKIAQSQKEKFTMLDLQALPQKPIVPLLPF